MASPQVRLLAIMRWKFYVILVLLTIIPQISPLEKSYIRKLDRKTGLAIKSNFGIDKNFWASKSLALTRQSDFLI
jgi:hypothetical protein